MSDKRFKSFEGMFGLESSMDITMLSKEQLCIIKEQKWSVYSEDKLQGLQESIKEWGILEPLIVRPAKDVPYPIDAEYEIISGRHRFWAGDRAGYDEYPCIVKSGLSADEVQIIMDETNMYQRGWADMKYSERAAVIATHYYATKNNNKRADFINQICEEIQALAKPVNTRADGGLSQVATNTNLRGSAAEFDLSKDTIARYLKIDTLVQSLKDFLDAGRFAFIPAVEISFLLPDHQDYLAKVLDQNLTMKLDMKKAEQLHALHDKQELNPAVILDVMMGKKVKKPAGRPPAFKLSNKIVTKYFESDAEPKAIEEIIDEALKIYFQIKEADSAAVLDTVYKEE